MSDHAVTATVAIDWDHQRILIVYRCDACGESQMEFPLAHLPSVYGMLARVLTDILGEDLPTASIPVSHQDMTEAEAQAHFRKGRH